MSSIIVSESKRPAPKEEEEETPLSLTSADEKTATPPQPKRRRVADSARVRAVRACQRCRRLKEKCDGRQPCQRCSRSNRDCEFAPVGLSGSNNNNNSSSSTNANTTSTSGSISKGGNGSGTSNTKALRAAKHSISDDLLGESSLVNADSSRSEERTRCLERLVQHLLGDVPLDLTNLRRMAEKAGRRTESEVGSTITGTDDLDDLTLEDENFTVKTLSHNTAHYSGEFSHWNFSQKLRRRLSQCLESDVTIPQIRRDLRNATGALQPLPAPTRTTFPKRAGMRILEYWRATQLQSPKTLVQSVLSCLPPRNVANFLVQIYFQFAQVNCFYAEEAWIRKKLNFLYEAPGHVTSEDSAWVCSVLMVLAIGTQFAHMAAGPPGDDEEGGQQHEERPSLLPTGPDSDVGVTFYQMASKLIPDIITIASMESVQACLLIAHYALPLDTHGLAYTYLGLGIKMAIQNGMHRRYTGTDLDAWTIETRNRLWWTAYTVERRVSVLHGRPTSIAPTEVDADLPKDLPEFRQHDEVSLFGNMSALIDMTLRLGDVANAITLLRRCPKNLQPTYFERIVDICQKLRVWWATLSPDVQNPTRSSPSFRSSAHLKLCLYLNDIFIGRPFIFSQSSATSPGAMSSPGAALQQQHQQHQQQQSSQQTPLRNPDAKDHLPENQNQNQNQNQDRPRNRAALVERAVDAAMNVVLLLRTLHETTGLARSSYTEFSSCRAALLVMLAQSVNRPQTPELRAAIDLGMQVIRRMAVGNVSTQSETSVIEALEIAVRRLQEIQQDPTLMHGGYGEQDVVAERARGGGGGPLEEVDVGKSGYERFREWASLWPAGNNGTSSSGGGGGSGSGGGSGDVQPDSSRALGKSTPGTVFADMKTPQSVPGTGGPGVVDRVGWAVPTAAGITEHSPESARWMTMMDTGDMGVAIEQLDDLGLFGGFPELGALDGWSGLT